MRARRKRHRWQIHRRDQLSRLQIRVDVRCVSRQPVKIGKRDGAHAFPTLHLHDGVERSERHVHIARVRRDALLALSKNGMDPVETIERAATPAGLPFVALGKGRIIKIIAAGALQ